MVDAVSSLAAIDLRMDEWRLDVVISGSQKAFMIPPGLCFMAFNDRAVEAYRNNKNPKFYWDINLGLQYLEKGQNPVTPPVSLYFGLQEAIRMMLEEGLDNILVRHRSCRDMVRESVRAMGLELLTPDACASPAVTSVKAPAGIGANDIRRYMLDEFNVVIAGGQLSLDNVIFRIGHLGYIPELELISVMAALEITLAKFNCPLELGAGVKKAQQFLLHKHMQK
jgi:aspartate aminotransferase-like enzyme